MDGNGRWAQERNLPRSEGHKAGARSVRTVVTECRRLGIPYLTLYAFSRENWKRPKEEVSFLFDLLVQFLKSEEALLLSQSIRLHVLGEIGEFPLVTRQVLKSVCTTTSGNTAMVLNLALNYSGRHEILQAVKRMISQKISLDNLDEEGFKTFLYTSNQPDPDLIIRTSGEQRMSNFLIYQGAYSELYFTPVFWPDFSEKDLHLALTDFRQRQRRFGGVQEDRS